ncbi:UDP-N-acetylmuramate dehydrogenase [Hathewaya proteolytica DSM 3090]|uniref:UDP-N-acetylenolpyruvoylglucosamine reductase n=1 Tax=Hathewaya proteolytica DSM 3090 TaxID=1121331 RepID=A0A1M6NGC3_9CLOT|nr:UDP-N-acetylmuramate dehydrogenase [Hathewaya proteolytica]SHJ94775.1 UDP-N-acetylmuramate dehydrogenase [Hathewaya proteolytica DSM 3090]
MFEKNILLEKLYNYLDRKNIELDVPMKEHTTFKLGGKAEVFVSPENYEQVRACLKCCIENNTPYFVLGKGSNLLVRDGGFHGVVINLKKLDKCRVEGKCVIAQGGATLIRTAMMAADNSLKNLEFASGIPGSVGGAIAMNAGAYGGEMSHVVKSIKVIDENMEIRDLCLQEIDFSYRNSIVLRKSYIVLECTFELEKGNEIEIKDRIKDLTRRRIEKQPLEKPSAGSTFKRPQGMFAGKLIEDTGLKGYSIGDAQVSEKHSNFLVNNGNATTADILKLIEHIQKEVYNKFKVNLETEVRIIGDDN